MARQQQSSTDTVGVSCGCLPFCRKKQPEPAPIATEAADQVAELPSASPRPKIRSSIYHSTRVGGSLDSVEDELFFFDALEDEDDYVDPYPIITSTYVKPKPTVSMTNPNSMLAESASMDSFGTPPGSFSSLGERRKRPSSSAPGVAAASTPTAPKKKISIKRLMPGSRRRLAEEERSNSMASKRQLQKLQEERTGVTERGYPGQLTVEELEATQRFYKELKKRPHLQEIVFAWSSVEEAPFALCRYMRATKFDDAAILERLEGDHKHWAAARDNEFYPNLFETVGGPPAVFTALYPYSYIGNAKNGCPVSYFSTGRLSVEGLLCFSSVERTGGYFWHQYQFTFKSLIRKAQEINPDFVRCEAINIIDLKGLQPSQLSSEVMDVMKGLGKISDLFPETMHCMLILNAPSFFSLSWRVIKSFIDPRTAAKIEVYSSEKRGRERLLELIDASEVPSDYGGKAPSTIERSVTEIAPYSRLIIEVLRIKWTGGSAAYSFELKNGETLVKLDVYTRSASSGKVSLSSESDILETIHAKPEETGKKEVPYVGNLTPFASCLPVHGPASLKLECVDKDSIKKKGCSVGYFLMVGYVSDSE